LKTKTKKWWAARACGLELNLLLRTWRSSWRISNADKGLSLITGKAEHILLAIDLGFHFILIAIQF
jgi:hypothetical protein